METQTMTTDLKLDQLCQDHLDGLADAIVDYCLAEFGPELGTQRALSAVGITTRPCGVRVPHPAHEPGPMTSCPGYRLTSWTAANRATAAGITADSPAYLDPEAERLYADERGH
jgi:hypothetical protein